MQEPHSRRAEAPATRCIMQRVNVRQWSTPDRVALAIAVACVFGFTWLLRFNDPNGSYAGLTDDHFFYLVRGWQILYGDLPVRDFVDHGAPLYYYVAAAVQLLFGRGTLSELTFTVTMIAAGAAATFWLASRASGSMALGLLGAAFHIWRVPRFYNYPKVLVYAAAIPLLWWLADRRGGPARVWLAVTTAIAFLFRHDHGAFVAAAVLAMLVLIRGISWQERLRHAAVYAGLTLVFLAPYLLFIEVHGGVRPYFQQALDWAGRERARTEIEWPGLFDYPDGVSADAAAAPLLVRPFWVVHDNAVAWLYYLELVLPFLALAVLAMSRDAFRPTWVQAWPKVAVVAVLGIVLNAGFLRSPLLARLADPSVPHAILIAWLAAALTAMFRLPDSWRPPLRRWRTSLASGMLIATAPCAFVLVTTVVDDFNDRLANAALTEGPTRALDAAASTVRGVRGDWELTNWSDRPERPGSMTLAMYVNACTPSGSRVFVQPYIPQVVALARRAFAGGHADLRSGFFDTAEAQMLTVERLRRQNVPIALLGEPVDDFERSFPIVGAYLREHYDAAGARTFDDRLTIDLLVRKDLPRARSYPELGWPCPA